MPRSARIVVPGVPHHVTQRGNRKLDVFFGDADRRRFLNLVLEYSRCFRLDILAYCLMPNHVHFVCTPSASDTLKLVFKPVYARYAQHINWEYSICGRLWQGRFFSCAMDQPHLWAAIRYVELNPVRAGLVKRAEDYLWSSAMAHCGLRDDLLLSPIPDSYGAVFGSWSEWLAAGNIALMDEALRKHTRTGRPLGYGDVALFSRK
jgi:putative transposase